MANADLRPMTLGEVLDRTFTLYKKNFWLFAGIMSLPLLLVYIVQITTATFRMNGRTAAGPVVPSPTMIAGVFGGVFVFLIIYFAIYAIAQAATVFAVSDLYLGNVATIRGAFASVRGRILRAIGVIFLILLMVGAVFVALIMAAALFLTLIPGLVRSPLILLVFIPIVIAFMIPGFFLLVRTAVAVPAAMLEDKSAPAAIGRSMDLTKGFGWQVFLIFILCAVLGVVAAAVFQYPFMFVTLMKATKHQSVSFVFLMFQYLSSFVSSVLVGPVATIAFSLMYYNLRVRKEAFDLQHLIASLPPGSQPVPPVPGAPSAA